MRERRLKALRDDTMETAQLLVRSSMKCVVLDQVMGLHPVKVMGEVGLRVPMFSCAPGKAILAHSPKAELAEWLSATRLKKYTKTTLTTKAALKEDLERTRKRGYAVDQAEGLEGIHCVGGCHFRRLRLSRCGNRSDGAHLSPAIIREDGRAVP